MTILTDAHREHFDEFGYMIIEERRQERLTLWRERRALGHGPYPGDPRGWEAKNYGSPELTPLGRKLLGLDLWD